MSPYFTYYWSLHSQNTLERYKIDNFKVGMFFEVVGIVLEDNTIETDTLISLGATLGTSFSPPFHIHIQVVHFSRVSVCIRRQKICGRSHRNDERTSFRTHFLITYVTDSAKWTNQKKESMYHVRCSAFKMSDCGQGSRIIPFPLWAASKNQTLVHWCSLLSTISFLRSSSVLLNKLSFSQFPRRPITQPPTIIDYIYFIHSIRNTVDIDNVNILTTTHRTLGTSLSLSLASRINRILVHQLWLKFEFSPSNIFLHHHHYSPMPPRQ